MSAGSISGGVAVTTLELAEGLGEEVGHVEVGGAAVGEGLVEVELGEAQAGERAGRVVAGVDADGAVRDVEGVLVLVEERRRAQEREVLRRQRVEQAALRLLPPGAQLVVEFEAGVLAEGVLAADGRVEPERRALVEEVEEHLLVVASQGDDGAFGRRPLQLYNIRDGAGDVLAAVDEVAEEDERVPSRLAREQGEQVAELLAAAVHVADDEGAQQASSAGKKWGRGDGGRRKGGDEDISPSP